MYMNNARHYNLLKTSVLQVHFLTNPKMGVITRGDNKMEICDELLKCTFAANGERSAEI